MSKKIKLPQPVCYLCIEAGEKHGFSLEHNRGNFSEGYCSTCHRMNILIFTVTKITHSEYPVKPKEANA